MSSGLMTISRGTLVNLDSTYERDNGGSCNRDKEVLIRGGSEYLPQFDLVGRRGKRATRASTVPSSELWRITAVIGSLGLGPRRRPVSLDNGLHREPIARGRRRSLSSIALQDAYLFCLTTDRHCHLGT
jgi:hypothetical protein